MKTALIFLPLLLFAVTFAQADQSLAPVNDKKTPFLFHPIPFPAFHYPLFPPHFFLTPFPYPFPFPFPSPSNNSSNPFPFPFPVPNQPPSAPSPSSDSGNDKFVFPLPYESMPQVNDDYRKCFMAVHDRSMVSCLNDFHSFLMTHQVSVSPGCCSALANIEDSCALQNPFLEDIVNHHCAAPTPSN